jgi:Cu2+-containing amine oxidase
VFLLLAALPIGVPAQSARHPLDGLTASEYWSVLDTLRASGHADRNTRFPFVTLREQEASADRL